MIRGAPLVGLTGSTHAQRAPPLSLDKGGQGNLLRVWVTIFVITKRRRDKGGQGNLLSVFS